MHFGAWAEQGKNKVGTTPESSINLTFYALHYSASTKFIFYADDLNFWFCCDFLLHSQVKISCSRLENRALSLKALLVEHGTMVHGGGFFAKRSSFV